jgi:hypothetical protein
MLAAGRSYPYQTIVIGRGGAAVSTGYCLDASGATECGTLFSTKSSGLRGRRAGHYPASADAAKVSRC